MLFEFCSKIVCPRNMTWTWQSQYYVDITVNFGGLSLTFVGTIRQNKFSTWLCSQIQ